MRNMIVKQNTSSGCSKPCSCKNNEVNWTQSPKHQVQQICRPQGLWERRYKKLNQYLYTERYSLSYCFFSYIKRKSLLCAHIASLHPEDVFAYEAFWFMWLIPSYCRRSLTAGPMACAFVTLTDISTLSVTNGCTIYDYWIKLNWIQ